MMHAVTMVTHALYRVSMIGMLCQNSRHCLHDCDGSKVPRMHSLHCGGVIFVIELNWYAAVREELSCCVAMYTVTS